MQSLLTDKTNTIITDFLSHYGSHANYTSAIYRMLYEIGKVEVSELNFDDYKKVIVRDKKTAQDSYKESFFRYLYAFDLMNNFKGLDKIWLNNHLFRNS
jgi:hypothetical protein